MLEQGEERDIQVFRAGGRVRRGTDRCLEQGEERDRCLEQGAG